MNHQKDRYVAHNPAEFLARMNQPSLELTAERKYQMAMAEVPEVTHLSSTT